MKLLEIEHPIIQAPMAGVTTPDLWRHLRKRAHLVRLARGILSAEETREFIREVKKADGEAVCGEFICTREGQDEPATICGKRMRHCNRLESNSGCRFGKHRCRNLNLTSKFK